MSLFAAIRHRIHSRLAVALALAVVAALVAVGALGAKVLMPQITNSRAMCAEFTDAVGLYPGNNVALLGIEVGTVTAITNKPDHVEVDFTVPKDLDLPADVGAVTFAQSVVTDRHVELTKAYSDGPKFTGSQCIKLADTKTPIGISETYSALGNLTDTILGAGKDQRPSEAPGVQAINDSLSAASHSLEGTGAGLNQTLRNLVTMVGDPYQADADYRQLFENSQILTSGWLKHWDTFATVVQTLPATAQLIEGLADNFATALSHLVHLLPILVDAINRFAPRIYHNITDKAIPWIRDLLNAWTPNIVGSINALPPLTNWLADIYDPSWGTNHVTYIAPRVAISPSQASAICTELRQRNIPGTAAACAQGTASDPVTLGLTNLIMGAALP
ncbi:MlaD family protein [Mycolicibacterium komossense]|uniref:MCE family protein n=1 Tax=Mycolicibacterium komossense TaxID=1779 RepID=A0ABT3CFW9_9MYCO|nr:MlaD family protein [Mycolicibacterium komossense]MCV7228365.1 MCE family protein [Mycolicibacterium komossense]